VGDFEEVTKELGCVNIGLARGAKLPVGVINRAVASPPLLRVNDASEGKSSMWMQMRMKSLEAGTSHASA